MASGFPGSIDSFTNPSTSSPLNNPSHAGQHQDLNDAVNKVETYMGLVKVIPTATTNGTIAANGTVTVGSGISSVSVTCFTTLYDNYRIIYSGGVGSAAIADLSFVLVGITTGYYGGAFGVVWNTNGFGGKGLSNAAAFSYAGYSDTGGALMSLDVYNPNKATRKYFRTDSYYSNTNEMFGIAQGTNGSTTQATAFTITPSTGTLTGGTIRVYGYRN